MTHKIKRALAITAMALMLAVGGAFVAQPAFAAGYSGTPSDPTPTPESFPAGTVILPAGTAPTLPGPGSSATFVLGGYSAYEVVTFTLTGEGITAGSLATIVKSVVGTASVTKKANSSGQIQLTVSIPVGASGFSLGGGNLPAVTGGGSSGTTTNPGSSLPRTGADSTMLLTLWVAGGALALAGASIVVGTAVRRQRATVAK